MRRVVQALEVAHLFSTPIVGARGRRINEQKYSNPEKSCGPTAARGGRARLAHPIRPEAIASFTHHAMSHGVLSEFRC